MAGHLPIGKSGFDIVFKNTIKKLHVTKLTYFDKEFHKKANCFIQRLPLGVYRMDEEHGKKDLHVVYLYKLDDPNYSYEVHLDKDWNINEVYQVL